MKRLLKRILPLGLCLVLGLPLGAQDLRLPLGDCIRAALDYSPSLKVARFDLNAASAQASARKAALLPTLDLDGHYDYIANVLPSISLPANISSDFGINNLDFGYHDMWSVGLSADWDIFGIYGNWRQAQAATRASEAAKAQLQDAYTGLLLKVRLAYFQTQLAESQVRLYAEALRLSQSQLHDLDLRLGAGSSSRIDWLTASNDELDQRASLRLAQVTLAGALRDLFALTGQDQDLDVSIPMDGADSRSLPAHVQAPTLVVTLDNTRDLMDALAPAADAPFKPQSLARLRALWAQVKEAQAQAQAAFAGHLPSGSVGFRWSEDYPEEPLPQAVNQQTTSASASLPLFSFGRVQDQVRAQRYLASAAQENADNAVTLTRTDWEKGRDRLEGLRVQRGLQAQEARQTGQLRDMVYKSYKIGGSTFLQVQSTSLEALQAGLALAETETNMLIELANLADLTDNDR